MEGSKRYKELIARAREYFATTMQAADEYVLCFLHFSIAVSEVFARTYVLAEPVSHMRVYCIEPKSLWALL